VGKLSMTDRELDEFLDAERVLHLATIDEDGWPAVVPVWFVWHDGAFWVWNLTRAKRTRRLREGTRCAFTVDTGDEYVELQGASGRLEYRLVAEDEVPDAVRVGFSRKYFGVDDPIEPADHHLWIRFVPATMNTWDFRKMSEG
jgi:hypothetical protein